MIANLPNQLPQNMQPAATTPAPVQQNLSPAPVQQNLLQQPLGSNPVMTQPQPQPLPVPQQQAAPPVQQQLPQQQAAPPVQQQQAAPPVQQQQTTPPNVEQNALAGNNKQNISNFMTALNNVGAGGNNSYMNTATTAAPVAQNLINPNMAYMNNGSAQGTLNGLQYNGPSQPSLGGTTIPMVGDTAGVTPTSLGGNGISNAGTSQPAGGTQVPIGGLGSVAQQNTQTPGAPNIPLQPQQQMLVSDENLKDNIAPASNAIQDFMSKIGAHNYTYKDPSDGVGTFTSPMAQELEKTELGKQAVIDTPRGKMVDYARLGGVNLAAVSVVHKAQEQLKAQVEQMRKQFKLVSKGK